MEFNFYNFSAGNNPTREFIEDQDEKSQTLIIKKIEEDYSKWPLVDLLRAQIIKKFENYNFHELIVGRFRFTGDIAQGVMHLVHAFKKEGNKTRKKDINTSVDRVETFRIENRTPKTKT